MIVRHIFEISDEHAHAHNDKNRRSSFAHEMEDDFALRYVRIYPGVNSRAELVNLAPGLRLERRFAPLAGGNKNELVDLFTIAFCKHLAILKFKTLNHI